VPGLIKRLVFAFPPVGDVNSHPQATVDFSGRPRVAVRDGFPENGISSCSQNVKRRRAVLRDALQSALRASRRIPGIHRDCGPRMHQAEYLEKSIPCPIGRDSQILVRCPKESGICSMINRRGPSSGSSPSYELSARPLSRIPSPRLVHTRMSTRLPSRRFLIRPCGGVP